MGKRGIRQRAADDLEQEGAASSSRGPDPEEVGQSRRAKGIRSRVLEEAVRVAPAEVGPRKRLKREVQEGAEAGAGEAEGPRPFNAAMRREWTKGGLKSNKVLEFSYKASSQGMPGAGKLNQNPNAKVAYRQLRSALGWPSAAPEFTWLEVTTKDGKEKTHPVICPIAFVESLMAHRPKEFEQRIKGD